MQGNTVCVLRDEGHGRHIHMHMWGGGKEGLERGDAKYGKSILGVTEPLMFVFGLHFEGRVSGCEGPAKAREGAREEAQMIRGNADKREHFGDVMQATGWQEEGSAHTCFGEVCAV